MDQGPVELERTAEVAAALDAGGAVVALESTVIAHGLPWPRNVEVAREMEAAIRRGGAVPATVGVIAGRLHVGLTVEQVERLARGSRVLKCAAADLGWAMAHGADGATTVSGTLFAAARAGIRVFATGGIGGVHRGDAGDVSADLATLAGEPVAVISAGAKSILDLPRTLEALETLGVPVVGLGTAELPAFYARTSGLRLELCADGIEEVAALCRLRWGALGQRGGVLVVHPVPAAVALPADEVDVAVGRALARAAAAGVTGKALTPWLLAELVAELGPRALDANAALLVDNARVAAELAQALAGRA